MKLHLDGEQTLKKELYKDELHVSGSGTLVIPSNLTMLNHPIYLSDIVELILETDGNVGFFDAKGNYDYNAYKRYRENMLGKMLGKMLNGTIIADGKNRIYIENGTMVNGDVYAPNSIVAIDGWACQINGHITARDVYGSPPSYFGGEHFRKHFRLVGPSKQRGLDRLVELFLGSDYFVRRYLRGLERNVEAAEGELFASKKILEIARRAFYDTNR